MKFFIIIFSILLCGCAKTSGIVDATKYKSYFEGATYSGDFVFVNSDTFPEQKKHRIFEQGATGSVPISSLKEKAYYKAGFFCGNKKGKPRVVAITEMTSPALFAPGNFPRYELVFICLQQEEEPFHIQNKRALEVQNDKYNKIKLLKELFDSGALTKDEFNKEKNKLLNK